VLGQFRTPDSSRTGVQFGYDKECSDKVSPRVRRDDSPPPADSSSTAAKIAADLRPSADGSAVRTSLVAGGG